MKADPTKSYWRELKLCQTSECAEKLVGYLDSTESTADTLGNQGQPLISSGSDASQTPTAREQIAVEPTSPAKIQTITTPTTPLEPTSKTNDFSISRPTIPAILAVLIVLTLWGFYARRKCPKCRRRGTLFRTNRQIVDQHHGTRIKIVQEVTEHRSKNNAGIQRATGTSVTQRQIPISTLSSTYLDTHKCKHCDHEFNSTSFETRDV